MDVKSPSLHLGELLSVMDEFRLLPFPPSVKKYFFLSNNPGKVQGSYYVKFFISVFAGQGKFLDNFPLL